MPAKLYAHGQCLPTAKPAVTAVCDCGHPFAAQSAIALAHAASAHNGYAHG